MQLYLQRLLHEDLQVRCEHAGFHDDTDADLLLEQSRGREKERRYASLILFLKRVPASLK